MFTNITKILYYTFLTFVRNWGRIVLDLYKMGFIKTFLLLFNGSQRNRARCYPDKGVLLLVLCSITNKFDEIEV